MKQKKFTMTAEDFDELSVAWEDIDNEDLSVVPKAVRDFWDILGEKLNFVPTTARHIIGKDPRYFLAEPLCMEGKCGYKTTRVR